MNGSQERRLPPWEEITYFQSPKISVVQSTGALVWVPLAPSDPNRVVLWLTNNSTASGSGRVSPDPSIDSSGGFLLTQQAPNQRFSEAEDGPLCTSAWWFFDGQPGLFFTVTQVILREWPEDDAWQAAGSGIVAPSPPTLPAGSSISLILGVEGTFPPTITDSG